jgi:IS30 family transposase
MPHQVCRGVDIRFTTEASALAGFSAKQNSMAALIRRGFTYDQGKEMAYHVATWWLKSASRLIFYNLRCRWQRGTYENTNGLRPSYRA